MDSAAGLPWRILADDLTGACDTGAVFARRGWAVRVALPSQSGQAHPAAQVWSSESRNIPEDAAVRAVEDLLGGLADQVLTARGRGYFYKKIDSTLRGHPGAELAAVLRRLGCDRALVCPAFPDQGRTVMGGRVLVSGAPLPDTPDLARGFEVGLDRRSVSLDAVREGVGKLAGALTAPGLYLADAETQADLEMLALAGLRAGIRLFCGSAGLARALADCLEPPGAPDTLTPRAERVVLAAGSRHAATLRQVAALDAAGWQILRLSNDVSRSLAEGLPLSGTRELALTVSGLMDRPGSERQIAEKLAHWTVTFLQDQPPAGLIVTGGDTAAAVCAALGCTAIDLGGEVLPGLAWGWLADGAHAGLPVITKAGGFGAERALLDAARFLRESH